MKWIGKSPIRKEDLRLVTGHGQYAGDVRIPGMLHAVVLRSSHAHARLKKLDVSRAKEMPGVVEVLVGEDVRGTLYQPLFFEGTTQKKDERLCLAVGKVLYVGEPIAVVVAEDRYVGEDALEEIKVEYEPLSAVVDVDAALKPDAPKLHEEWGDNIGTTFHMKGGDVETAFKEAHIVVSATMKMHRHFASPLEGRVVVADYNPVTEELVMWDATQGPYRTWYLVARVLGIPENKLRVITKDVGGSFGVKNRQMPETFLIPYLSRKLGRPVKWVEDRREHFLGSHHGRELKVEAEMAAKKDGTILGLRGKIYGDQGAQVQTLESSIAAISSVGPYKIPAVDFEGLGIVTNKVPTGAYRALGEQTGCWIRECLMDKVATKIGIDPAAIRMKNFIQPDELPYQTPLPIVTYHGGNYPEAFQKGLNAFDYKGWREKQARLRDEGRYIGIGISCYLEITGWGPSKLVWALGIKSGGYASARVVVRMEGQVTVYSSVTVMGQGAETAMAQICAHELGVDYEDVSVIFGDYPLCPPDGYQLGASRGVAVGGTAVLMAARKIIDKVKKIAAHYLRVSEENLEYKDGKAVVRGYEERFMTLQQAARAAYEAKDLPEGMEPGLEAMHTFDPLALDWTFGAQFAAVEVDPETFKTKVLDFLISHDCGVVINPAIVDGQLNGAITQCIGAAFSEELVYDENGQLLTTNFTDYGLPRAGDIPEKFTLVSMETPTALNPLGARGVGESGTNGGYAVLAAAVKDALSPLEYDISEFPLTPSKLYERVKSRLSKSAGCL